MHAFDDAGVRFVVIGVWGASIWAGDAVFQTKDQDLFLPPDAANLLRAWRCCERLGLDLVANDESLDQPRDAELAAAVVRRAAERLAREQRPQVADDERREWHVAAIEAAQHLARGRRDGDHEQVEQRDRGGGEQGALGTHRPPAAPGLLVLQQRANRRPHGRGGGGRNAGAGRPGGAE
jgi:hypothetical protein